MTTRSNKFVFILNSHVSLQCYLHFPEQRGQGSKEPLSAQTRLINHLFRLQFKVTKSSLDVLWDLLQNNSQVLTELIHFRLIKPLMKAHPNTDQLNIVVLGCFFFPCRWNRGFCAVPEVKRGTWAISCFLVFPFNPESKSFQQKNIVILTVKPSTHLVTTHGRMGGSNREKLRVLKIWSRSLERMYWIVHLNITATECSRLFLSACWLSLAI